MVEAAPRHCQHLGDLFVGAGGEEKHRRTESACSRRERCHQRLHRGDVVGGVEDDERLLRDPFDPRRQADRTQSLYHCPVCHANALRIEAAGRHYHDCRIDRLVAATHGQREDERLGSWCIDQRHRHTAGGERIGEGIAHIRW